MSYVRSGSHDARNGGVRFMPMAAVLGSDRSADGKCRKTLAEVNVD